MTELRLVPFTPTIALRSTTLPQPFHDDPGDQIIVATAKEENATLITKDQLIQKYDHARTMCSKDKEEKPGSGADRAALISSIVLYTRCFVGYSL